MRCRLLVAAVVTATGWITFELPDDAKVTGVRFASGIKDVARWSVG